MLRAAPEGTTVDIRVVPRAGQSRVSGVRDGALLVYLAAPPVDGAANAELIAVLAGALRVPKRSVTIVRGDTSRRKTLLVAGITPSDLTTRLLLPPS